MCYNSDKAKPGVEDFYLLNSNSVNGARGTHSTAGLFIDLIKSHLNK